MEAKVDKVLEFLKSVDKISIPIYQRLYSWEREQCIQLLKDVISVGKHEKQATHFMGSIIFFQVSEHPTRKEKEIFIIDGQQRLTTITLLIAAVAEITKDLSDISNNKVDIAGWRKAYLLNSSDGDSSCKLHLSDTDKETLGTIVEQRDLPEKHSKRIQENYETIKSWILNPENLGDENILVKIAENIVKLFDGLSRLEIVSILLKREADNPQLIFESMNAKGYELSQADLVRNFVLMGQEQKAQANLYKNFWHPMEVGLNAQDSHYHVNEFVRHYLIVEGSVPRGKRDVYNKFKDYMDGQKSSQDIERVVKNMLKFSAFYRSIALRKEENFDLLSAFKSINRLRIGVAYPLLMKLYRDYVEEKLSREDFLAILHMIESYIFRRAICGLPTNSHKNTFINFCETIKTENHLSHMKEKFANLEYRHRFPADDEFRTSMQSRDDYHKFSNTDYLLRKVEDSFVIREKVDTSECTLEHIMPRNLSPDWEKSLGSNHQSIRKQYLNTLGNLTLTGYNSRLSNRPFKKKRDIEGGFCDSRLKINESLCKRDKWNAEGIKERTEELAELALKVWTRPF